MKKLIIGIALASFAAVAFAEKGPGTFFNPSDGNAVAGVTNVQAAVHRTVAFLGGSITEMNGFRPRVMKALRAKYPDVAFTEFAAGLSSTCSDTAAFRLRRDVLSQCVPDLLIVDEAVNDEQDGHFAREHAVRGLEGIVRQTLTANPKCRIVLALMVNEGQYAELMAGKVPLQYAVEKEVAKHYGLAVADVGSALAASARSGGMSWKEYKDCHPSPAGCDLGAKVVMEAVSSVYDPRVEPTSQTVPAPMDAMSYFNAYEVPLESVKGGDVWKVSALDWAAIAGEKRDYFARGDVLWCETTNAVATVSFKGTAVGFTLTAGPDAGDLEVSVDDGAFSLIRLRANYGRLHYPYTLMVADDLAPGAHTVRFRTVAAQRGKRIGMTVRINRICANGERTLAERIAVAAERSEVLLSDIAALAGKTEWRPVAYETQDGIRGTMLCAPWGLKPHTRIAIPLNVRGRYRIRLGLGGRRTPFPSLAPCEALVRLARDPAPVRMDVSAPSADAGWWWQPVENEWKVADLDNDTLIVENPRGCYVALAWVRLMPEEKRVGGESRSRVGGESRSRAGGESRSRTGDMIATNDACAPSDNMDELLAPIMRLKDSPVREIHYCVGNGAFSFAVPSKVAVSSSKVPQALYESEYTARCAESFAWMEREHPRLVDELADFTHAQGMKFVVSFRTGCTLDVLRRTEEAGTFPMDGAGFGICATNRLCRLWDGTPVARFSYADKGVQDWFLRFYAEMLTEKVDGISLIWIRALPAMLFEPAFRERFRAAYGEELARADDPRVRTLRAEVMTEFHRRVRALAGKRRVTIFVPPDAKTCAEFGLDLRRLAEEGIVDEFIAGNTKQTARHDEGFQLIDFAFFRSVCAGTRATFRTYFWGWPPDYVKSVAEGAKGVAFWDAGVKSWRTWEETRLLDDGTGARAAAWEKANPASARVHPLKTLDGFDMATHPWHVAY